MTLKDERNHKNQAGDSKGHNSKTGNKENKKTNSTCRGRKRVNSIIQNQLPAVDGMNSLVTQVVVSGAK